MLENIFNFSKDSPGEKYLFEQFGRKNKDLNQTIRAVPVLGTKVYKLARGVSNSGIREAAEEYGRRVGNPDIYKNLSSGQSRQIEMEIINLAIYFLEKELGKVIEQPEVLKSFIHAIYLELQRHYLVPDTWFFKYSKLNQQEVPYKNIKERFIWAIASLISDKQNPTLISSLESVPSRLREEVHHIFKTTLITDI